MQEITQNLHAIFNNIRRHFQPSVPVTSLERRAQQTLSELIRDFPGETARIGDVGSTFYYYGKISRLKRKLAVHFNELGGRNKDVIGHFRVSIINRLQRLLPELCIVPDLLSENQAGIEARQQLSRLISYPIPNQEGEEKSRYIQAFELITALQALYVRDPVVEWGNPLLQGVCNEWLCYMYLASRFFESGDITFPQAEEVSDSDFQDRVFQCCVHTISCIIRGHNEDYWNDPYHPENAPSCYDGAKGHFILSSGWHKDLSFFPSKPVFNSPTKAVEAAILNEMLQDLQSGSIENSEKLLKTLEDLRKGEVFLPKDQSFNENNQENTMESYPFLRFFNWSEAKQNVLAENLANRLINEWTTDLSQHDKDEVMRLYKDKVKCLVRHQINSLLVNKYSVRKSKIENGGLGIDVMTMERFKAVALTKLFENPDRDEEQFLKFYELPGMMDFYYQARGEDMALALWRKLRAFKEDLIIKDFTPAPQYTQLLVDWTIASLGKKLSALKALESVILTEILLVDTDKGKSVLNKEVELKRIWRDQLLKILNWNQLSYLFRKKFGRNWQLQVINGPLDYLLTTMLRNNQYADFSKMVAHLYSSCSLDYWEAIFKNKYREKIQERLTLELQNGQVDLLIYLRKHKDEIFGPSQPQYSINMVQTLVMACLNHLTLPSLQLLLDEKLRHVPDVQRMIAEDLGNPDFVDFKRQMEILDFFEAESHSGKIMLGQGSLTYIKLILDRDPVNEDQKAIKNKAQTCWNRFCTKAIQRKIPEACRGLWKLNAEEIKNALIEVLNTLLAEEDLSIKATKRKDLSFLLSIIQTQPATRDWVQALYDQAYRLEDWETCRLFLPVFKHHPEFYRLLPPEVDWFAPQSDRKAYYQIVGEIAHGVEKEALVSLLYRIPERGTLPRTRNIEVFCHLLISPLSQMQYTGEIEEVRQLHEMVRVALSKLIESQINHLLLDNLSYNQVVVSQITGKLMQKFTDYFAEFPEDPQEALEAYEQIIREAQTSIDERLGANEFTLRSFLVNALCILLTGGLALFVILIDVLVRRAREEDRGMPKYHLKKTFKGLKAAYHSNGFFAGSENAFEAEEISIDPEVVLPSL